MTDDPGIHGICDKCRSLAIVSRVCSVPGCNRIYRRCAAHDGMAGIMRSLHSHRALYHSMGGVK